MYGTLAVIAAVAAFIALVPFPFNVMCTLEIEPDDPEQVYVVVPGTLEKVHVKAGDTVDAGQPLAELDNDDLEISIVDLAGKRDMYEAQLRTMAFLKSEDNAAYGQIPQLEKSKDSVEEQLKQKLMDREKLTLVSAKPGVVMRPPETPKRPEEDGQLPTWYGTPLKPENQGCTLTEGTLFCQVGDPKQMKATLVIDQADIESVRLGQNVRIQLDELPGERLPEAALQQGRRRAGHQDRCLGRGTPHEHLLSGQRSPGRRRGHPPSRLARAGQDRRRLADHRPTRLALPDADLPFPALDSSFSFSYSFSVSFSPPSQAGEKEKE
jgi:hypothetical protein